MKSDHVIVGIHVTDRVKKVPEIQKVLTDYGCSIRTRLGLHEASENFCSPAGLIVLEFVGGHELCQEMMGRLTAIDGVGADRMVFTHD